MSLHRAVFAQLVARNGWACGAELGVDKGLLFSMLLDTCPALFLIGVDVFPLPHRRERVEAIAAAHPGRCALHAMTTRKAAALVPDRSLDFVFIDADHSDAAVTQDINMWRPKVRPGGWLGGHDYHPRKFPGVVRAVDRVFGLAVKRWPGTIWGVLT